MCRRYEVLPIARSGDNLILAMVDPGNVFAIDDVRAISRMQVKCVVAERSDLRAAIDRFHRADGELSDLEHRARGGGRHRARASPRRPSPRRTTRPSCASSTCSSARRIQDQASDIHIEPGEYDLRVRYRIDGVLHEMQRAPKNIQNGVISRLKIMSDIDIAERRKPQDGRMSVSHGGRKIDLRVATLPTVWGEKVVMRILDNSTLEHGDRGPRAAAAQLRGVPQESYTKPYGMILVTGPDRFRQVDDALHDAPRRSPARRSTSSPSRTRSSTACRASTRCR